MVVSSSSSERRNELRRLHERGIIHVYLEEGTWSMSLEELYTMFKEELLKEIDLEDFNEGNQ